MHFYRRVWKSEHVSRYHDGMTMIQIEATTVPEILRATRALSGLTVREIAPQIGVSHGTISAWERGQGEPNVTQFLRWARATKQPAQLLLDGLSLDMRAPRDSNPQPSDP
ncbi:helix-turn-helix domain-containing protein [Microbacterium sp. XT11]|uniref:helix-turn-helix domain-containing protein n=1 Tax=Microbacterium sp. XT11 TaxID=367477 RepID=UPI0009FA750F